MSAVSANQPSNRAARSRALAHPADPDRHAPLGRRLQAHAFDGEVRAAVLDHLAVEQRADDIEPLVEPLGARPLRFVLAEARELAVTAAEAGAEDHAPAAEPVERRDLVRGTCGRRRATGVTPVPSMTRSVDAATAPSVTRIGGSGRPDEPEVVPDEETVPPRVLRGPRELDDRVRVGVGADVGDEQPELHGP